MPESAEEVYARVVAAVGEDGRLPMPPVHEWDMFPWEVVDGRLQPKVVQAPADEEPRWGESDAKPCGSCLDEDDDLAVWENERWVVTRGEKPGGLPLMLFLRSKEHMDFPDMDDELASEYGRIS